jgi:hypothetical protein
MRGIEVLLKLRTRGHTWSPCGAGCTPSAWAACPTCRTPRSTPWPRPRIRRPTSGSTGPSSTSTPCMPTTSGSMRRSTTLSRKNRPRPWTPSGPANWPPSAWSRASRSPRRPPARDPGPGGPHRRRQARALSYAPPDPQASLHGSWKNAFVGGSYEFLRNGARLLDARTSSTTSPPSSSRHVHVDLDPPAKNFWAVDVYDTQTRSLTQIPSTIWPALPSSTGQLQANPDGSYDLYFGPTAPEGKESNWVQTLPGKSWFVLFRLYGPLQPWFDQAWKLNEFNPSAERHSHQARPRAIGGNDENHGRERFLTRLPAVPPGPVAHVLLPVEFAKSCSPRWRGLRMPDQSIHPAANQDTWPAPAP